MARDITDLWVVGKQVTLDDGQVDEHGDPKGPFTFWLQKLSPAESAKAAKRANAARSAYLAFLNAPDVSSVEYQALRGEILSLDDDRNALLDVVLMEEMAHKELAISDEIASHKEWDDDSYLEGLQDSWESGLKDSYAKGVDDENYPEAEKVFSELTRFAEEVEAEIAKSEKALKRNYEGRDLEWLQEHATKAKIKEAANLEWMTVFRKAELWQAVRDVMDHAKLLFRYEQVDTLPAEALRVIVTEYRKMTVDPIEGKG